MGPCPFSDVPRASHKTDTRMGGVHNRLMHANLSSPQRSPCEIKPTELDAKTGWDGWGAKTLLRATPQSCMGPTRGRVKGKERTVGPIESFSRMSRHVSSLPIRRTVRVSCTTNHTQSPPDALMYGVRSTASLRSCALFFWFWFLWPAAPHQVIPLSPPPKRPPRVQTAKPPLGCSPCSAACR